VLKEGLHGVVPAIVTPVDSRGEPDAGAFVELAHWMLENGADALNVLGTTGEATSFSRAQRLALMQAVGRSSLPHASLMVGTGAAAVNDAIAFTQAAAANGFAGALVLPPFYYKNVPEDGVVRYFDAVVNATSSAPAPVYLYNFPALSGVAFPEAMVRRLVGLFGERIAGMKDSSGDVPLARAVAAIDPRLRVFPSNEATLLDARNGPFAGCISASACVNSAFCARAYRLGDTGALDRAVAIRKLFEGIHYVPSVKALLARRLGKPALARVLPPFVDMPEADAVRLAAAVDAILAEA
jgi:4-hydroxy-tetrahydrodipicolinate synthase